MAHSSGPEQESVAVITPDSAQDKHDLKSAASGVCGLMCVCVCVRAAQTRCMHVCVVRVWTIERLRVYVRYYVQLVRSTVCNATIV